MDNLNNYIEKLENKIAEMSYKEILEMEKKLEIYTEKIKNFKTKIMLNKFQRHKELSEDYKIIMEEVIEGLGRLVSPSLAYNIYIVRDNIKLLLPKDIKSAFITEFDLTAKSDYIIQDIRIAKLDEKNKEAIILAVAELQKTLPERLEELEILSKNEYNLKRAKRAKEIIDEENKHKSEELIRQEVVLKKFYITLAKKIHPDLGGTSEEMQMVNYLKKNGDWNRL